MQARRRDTVHWGLYSNGGSLKMHHLQQHINIAVALVWGSLLCSQGVGTPGLAMSLFSGGNLAP